MIHKALFAQGKNRVQWKQETLCSWRHKCSILKWWNDFYILIPWTKESNQPILWSIPAPKKCAPSQCSPRGSCVDALHSCFSMPLFFFFHITEVIIGLEQNVISHMCCKFLSLIFCCAFTCKNSIFQVVTCHSFNILVVWLVHSCLSMSICVHLFFRPSLSL